MMKYFSSTSEPLLFEGIIARQNPFRHGLVTSVVGEDEALVLEGLIH